MLIAIPSAYAMAFNPGCHTKDILLRMLSTKKLLAVVVLMPIYLLAQKFGLLDTKLVLVIIYALINLLIIMMILFNYFRQIPKKILAASRMDGTSTLNEITQIAIPLALGGHCTYGAALDHFMLERSLLGNQFDGRGCWHLDRVGGKIF